MVLRIDINKSRDLALALVLSCRACRSFKSPAEPAATPCARDFNPTPPRTATAPKTALINNVHHTDRSDDFAGHPIRVTSSLRRRVQRGSVSIFVATGPWAEPCAKAASFRP